MITIPPVLETVALTANQPKVSVSINENSILSNYEESCISKGITNQVFAIIKGENLPTYPSHHHLIANCKMKPSSDLYHWAKDPHFNKVVVFVVRWPGVLYLTANNLESLRSLNKHYCAMIDDIQRLQFVDFLPLKMSRLDYAEQMSISSERVDLATACVIHYGLNVGMVIRYLKGEYIGESQGADAILSEVSPHINRKDCKHIKQIIDQGCPSHLDFEEDYENKHYVLQKGNQQTFLQHPKVTAKTMNKEEKNSHVLPFKI